MGSITRCDPHYPRNCSHDLSGSVLLSASWRGQRVWVSVRHYAFLFWLSAVYAWLPFEVSCCFLFLSHIFLVFYGKWSADVINVTKAFGLLLKAVFESLQTLWLSRPSLLHPVVQRWLKGKFIQVVPNLYDSLCSVEHKRCCSKKCHSFSSI